MFDYVEELQRRIAQFACYLKKMHHRAHEEVHGNCFIIFKEGPWTQSSDQPTLSEAAKPPIELVVAGFNEAGISNIAVESDWSGGSFPENGWKVEESTSRFIQFSFERNWFCLDMPLQTLYRTEATQILRSRKGFFYLRDRPQFTLHGEDVEGYDPFRKVYVYGDESSAAEDMAFVFFQVWRFPVNWRLFMKTAAFGDKNTNWENETPLA